MRFERVSCFAVLGVSLFAVSAMAGTLTVGFESPYAAGNNINGQQGWSNTHPYDANVTSAEGYGGSSQSLQISDGITSGSFGDQTFTPHLAQSAGESTLPGTVNTFLTSWYFKSATDLVVQDGLGISVSADNGTGARMSWVRMGDDATMGMNLQFADTDSTGNFIYTQLATHLDRTLWHRVDMNIYFVDGAHNDIVKISLDNQVLISGTTWEDFYRFGPTSDGGGHPLAPVDSLEFRAGGDQLQAHLGNGFLIDNVSLTSQTPEPGTVGLLLTGIGLIALARRKRAA